MKRFQIAETKSQVIILWEDDLSFERGELRLTNLEAPGLYWALKDALNNPAFAEREPRPRGVHKEVRRIVIRESE